MITLRDLQDQGVELQAAQITIKHYDYEHESFDIEVSYSDTKAREQLMDREIKYIYPASDEELVVEVDD